MGKISSALYFHQFFNKETTAISDWPHRTDEQDDIKERDGLLQDRNIN